VLQVLGCLQRQTHRGFRVFLVDDGSTDGTAEAVRRTFPEVSILQGDGNLWWTGAIVLGVNHVLSRAQPKDSVLLLNNDLTIDDDYLQSLVEVSSRQERAIVGSTLFDFHSRRFVEAGITMDYQLNLFPNTKWDQVVSRDVDEHVDVLPGRGTLIPVDVFSTIGTFNRRKLPHYGSDYEFSVRAKRAGYKLVIAHKARVYSRQDMTGLECPDTNVISLTECCKLLFSRKSKTNIVYYLNYVWLCSESAWRWRNVLVSIRNILSRTVGRTIPGRVVTFFVSPVVKPFVKVYRFLFSSYSLRIEDLAQCQVVPRELVQRGILSEFQVRGTTFFVLNKFAEKRLEGYSGEMIQRIQRLSKLACSFRHKIAVHRDSFRNAMLRLRHAQGGGCD
jgi:GT2 family glycosyltransferase